MRVSWGYIIDMSTSNVSSRRTANVFVSTGAFGRMTVEEIIEAAASAGISHIELASGTRHDSGDDLALALEAAKRPSRHPCRRSEHLGLEIETRSWS